MTGFLDPQAPSIEAEYDRYVDGDILGKLLFKNFWLNILKQPNQHLYLPLGRWGDVGAVMDLEADAVAYIDGRRVQIELKCAKVNIANRTRGQTKKNWNFSRLLASPGGARKTFDVAVCIGVMLPGLEEARYWDALDEYRQSMGTKGVNVVPTARPHEPDFLRMCGFFFLPFNALQKSNFRVTVAHLQKCKYRDFFAWGHEQEKCRRLWDQAVAKRGKRMVRIRKPARSNVTRTQKSSSKA